MQAEEAPIERKEVIAMKIQRKEGSKATVKVTPSVPAAVTWEPYFERMQESMMQRFHEFFAPSVVNLEFESAPFNMRETERGFVVSAVMPGFKESEVEVQAEEWRLFLHAKHEEPTEKGESVFKEYREFTRWIEFPAEVNPETAKAVLSKGVLEVTLEKAQVAKKVVVHPKAA
jgi:HSP20 family molecular chaperone IbpA